MPCRLGQLWSESDSGADVKAMEMASTTPTPAPYGRSCTNCSKAKCRCVYSGTAGATKCERCRRLNRECVPSPYTRKKATKKTVGSRTAQLEAKLDDLVSILKNQNGKREIELPIGSPRPADELYTPPESTSSAAHTGSDGQNAAASTSTATAVDDDTCNRHADRHSKCCPENFIPREFAFHEGEALPQDGPASILSAMPCPGEPSGAEAERILDWFRTTMAMFLPFIYLPAGMTSARLRAEKPFTWLNVMYAGSHSTQQQGLLSQSIKQIVASKVVVEEIKNLDILTGLLIFMGWMQLQPNGRRCLGTFTGIAQSIVFDLCLHEQEREQPLMLAFKYGKLPRGRPPPKQRTMDERRAVLMFFLQSSSAFTSLKRIEPLKWNPHLDECVQALQDQAEYDGDVILAGLVKLQLVLEQTHRAQLPSYDGQARKQPAAFIETLHSQVARIRESMPPEIQKDLIFQKYYHYATLRIHELHLPRPLPTLQSPWSTTAEPDIARFNVLHACLLSLKAWFEVLFALPRSAYIGFSFPCYAHMAHCLISLHKLSALQDVAWDNKMVRRELDLFEVCDRLHEDLEFVVKQYRPDCGEGDLFVKCVKALRSFRALWWADLEGANSKAADGTSSGGVVDRIAQHTPAATPVDGQAMAGFQGFGGGQEGIGDLDMTMFATDEWLADIFNQGWVDMPQAALGR